MKKEYLEPQSAIVSFPCFVWMTEGISEMGSGDKGTLTPKTVSNAPKTV